MCKINIKIKLQDIQQEQEETMLYKLLDVFKYHSNKYQKAIMRYQIPGIYIKYDMSSVNC